MAAAQQVTDISIITASTNATEAFAKAVRNAGEAVDKLTGAQGKRKEADDKATQATRGITAATTSASSATGDASRQLDTYQGKLNSVIDASGKLVEQQALLAAAMAKAGQTVGDNPVSVNPSLSRSWGDTDVLAPFRQAVIGSTSAFTDAEKAVAPFYAGMEKLRKLMADGTITVKEYAEAQDLIPELLVRGDLAREEAEKNIKKLGDATIGRIGDMRAEAAATAKGGDALKAYRRERELNNEVLAFTADLQAKVERGYDLEGKSVEQLSQDYRKAREALMDAPDKAVAASKAREEAEKSAAEIKKKAGDLSQEIAEAIYDAGSKGGKGFWEKFQEWGRSTLKRLSIDMILKPVIQPVMASIVGAVPQLFGIGTAGGLAAGAGANAAGAGSGGVNPATNLFGQNGFTGIGDLGGLLSGDLGKSVQGFLGTPLFTSPFAKINPGNMSANAAEAAQVAAGNTGAFTAGNALSAVGYGINSFMNFRSGNTLGGIGNLAATAMMFIPGAQMFAPFVALGSQLLGGMFADEKHPVGNAFFAGVDNNRFDPNGPTTTLDGGDTEAAIKMRATTAKMANQMVDKFSLTIDKNFFSPSITNPRLGGFGNTSNLDLAKSPEEWIRLAFMHNPRSVAVDTSAYLFEREKGYTQTSTYDRDTGTVTSYRDKEGKELTKELWDKAYEDWVKEKQAAATTGGPSTLFTSQDVNVQKVLDRMAGGQLKVGEVEDITKALEYATKFNDNARLAAAGLDTLARQTVEFEIAARDAAKSFKTGALQYIDDAKKYFGEDSPLVADATQTQRDAALSAIGLIPANIKMTPGDERGGTISLASVEKPLTGFAAQMAQAKANIEAMKPALEALGYTSKQATDLINAGIRATTERLGEKVREDFTLTQAGLRPGGSEVVARYQMLEQQKQKAADWTAAGVSQAEIDAVQKQQREMFERNLGEQRVRRLEGVASRYGAAAGAYDPDLRDKQELDAMARRHRQELSDLDTSGLPQAEIDELKKWTAAAQSLEKAVLERNQTESRKRIDEGLSDRLGAAQVVLGTKSAADYARDQLLTKQRQEMWDAQNNGMNEAQVERLDEVHTIERQVQAYQQAIAARQREEGYLQRTANALAGVLTGSPLAKQAEYLSADIARQIAQAAELRDAQGEADRARILEIQKLEDSAVAAQRAAEAHQRLAQAQIQAAQQVDQLRTQLAAYRDQLSVDNNATTPASAYAEARRQLEEQLAKARAGDTTAMSGIQTYMERFRTASLAFNASTEGYQADVEYLKRTATNLPGEINQDEIVRLAIEKLDENLTAPTQEQVALLDQLQDLSKATKDAIQSTGRTAKEQQDALAKLEMAQTAAVQVGNQYSGTVISQLSTQYGTLDATRMHASTTATAALGTEVVAQSINAWTQNGVTALNSAVSLLGMIYLRQYDVAQIIISNTQHRQALWDSGIQPFFSNAAYWLTRILMNNATMVSLMGGAPSYGVGTWSHQGGPAVVHRGEILIPNLPRGTAVLNQTMQRALVGHRAANDDGGVLEELRDQKRQGEQMIGLLGQLLAQLAQGGESSLDDVVDAINGLRPALRGNQAPAGARPISKAG